MVPYCCKLLNRRELRGERWEVGGRESLGGERRVGIAGRMSGMAGRMGSVSGIAGSIVSVGTCGSVREE